MHHNLIINIEKLKELVGKMIKIQCPHCFKLYSVKEDSLPNSEPNFECKACSTIFKVILSEQNLYSENPICGEILQSKIVKAEDEVNCPKCAAINAFGSKECYSCQVVFEKIKDLPLDSSEPVTNELIKRWSDVLAHYEQFSRHENFVRNAHLSKCLNFALQKYSNILEAQPFDETAKKMKTRILSLQIESDIKSTPSTKKFNFWKLLYYAPYAIAAAVLFSAMAFHSAQNLLGFGAAILFFTVVFDKNIKSFFTR